MKNKKKRLIRGVDNFKDIITRNGYFVDKTLLIKEVIEDSHNVILIPRPRRFGKSLNLSMLATFFDIAAPQNRKLFEEFKIWKAGTTYTQKQGKYPVIHLTLKSLKQATFKECIEDMAIILSELFEKYDVHLILTPAEQGMAGSVKKVKQLVKKDTNFLESFRCSFYSP